MLKTSTCMEKVSSTFLKENFSSKNNLVPNGFVASVIKRSVACDITRTKKSKILLFTWRCSLSSNSKFDRVMSAVQFLIFAEILSSSPVSWSFEDKMLYLNSVTENGCQSWNILVICLVTEYYHHTQCRLRNSYGNIFGNAL